MRGEVKGGLPPRVSEFLLFSSMTGVTKIYYIGAMHVPIDSSRLIDRPWG
jgi:hypothetical protein